MKWPFRKDGFTMVELLVVLAMIVILAVIATPIFVRFMQYGYKTELDSDARNSFTAANTYLTDFPNETINSIAKLKTGGYRRSPRISFLAGDLTKDSGSFELLSNEAGLVDKNAVIFYNGRIEYPNQPK